MRLGRTWESLHEMVDAAEQRLRVSVVRVGGFAAIRRPLGAVDTASLPPAEAGRLRQLVRDAGFFELPEVLGAAGEELARDRFSYTVTVAVDGREKTVHASEGSVLQPLVDFVRELGRQQRGGTETSGA